MVVSTVCGVVQLLSPAWYLTVSLLPRHIQQLSGSLSGSGLGTDTGTSGRVILTSLVVPLSEFSGYFIRSFSGAVQSLGGYVLFYVLGFCLCCADGFIWVAA